MKLEWNFVKMPLVIKDIEKLEFDFQISFPLAYKKILYHYHGGRPNKRRFITYTRKERVIKSFLPIKQDYTVNVYEVRTWLKLPKTMFPFANTPSGDYLCLCSGEGETEPIVVLYHHEIDGVEYVSKNFQTFINAIY
ncbi:SMI1/KNR4 family protein [Peribacillus kribbensis]|uniref:SMI1/KNR4 family protein n=1 Tax=Peribacillus kribbensis TaxID=356658 RepID=UPI000411634B|nr:SMI1/KNR4 family protein [Peribacillus kribbensis]